MAGGGPERDFNNKEVAPELSGGTRDRKAHVREKGSGASVRGWVEAPGPVG